MSGYKKVIYMLLSIILLGMPVMSVQAKEASETMTFTYVNPVYQYLEEENGEESIRSYDLKKSTFSAQPASVAEEDYLTDEEDIAAVIREGMVAHKEEISVYYKSKVAFDEETVKKWFGEWVELAMAETNKPYEGDYLRWHYKKIGANISVGTLDDTYYYDFVFTVDYYTTAAQEAEVTEEVARVLDALGVNDEDVSDYDAIKYTGADEQCFDHRCYPYRSKNEHYRFR